jgi:hypothetical protein
VQECNADHDLDGELLVDGCELHELPRHEST